MKLVSRENILIAVQRPATTTDADNLAHVFTPPCAHYRSRLVVRSIGHHPRPPSFLCRMGRALSKYIFGRQS